jgi:glycosyltransferase involved in cell wall biosynthesis
VARRIKKIYRREAEVIYPPVNVERFTLCTQKEDFYLAASRMVPYKKIGLIVQAFARMRDKRLIVIGDGPGYKSIKSLATKNVELLGFQPDNVLKNLLERTKAFIFAAEEDFGILPVEAQACGTPVIAYGRGGVLETVIPGKSGILFDEQSEDSIIDAIKRFESTADTFQPDIIRSGVEKFSPARFKNEFKTYVDRVIKQFFN